ncbi:hypothetical protein K7W42_19290 [Deinococcus sp. HMF7604]|uniref:hypothetical protein n=1 Tax=Deinococcus betulae TaxID=2873312 RepID=UPI001CC98F78|nr:hypothetical protein [Deinococcus betulae]MBZ9752986.1 hypothetical protein [Deinococcus betulae]
MSKRQQDREYEQALAQADDPVLRGLITATYQRLRRGYVRVGDLKGHYTYDLGLLPRTDGCFERPTNLPPIIRTQRLFKRGAS